MLGRGDAGGAVTALRRAAELSPALPDKGRRLLAAAVVSAEMTGELTATSALLADAGRADPGLDRSLRAALVRSHLLLAADGQVGRAHRLLVDAIEVHGTPDAGDEAMIAALHSLRAVCWSGGHRQLWAPFTAAVSRLSPGTPPELAVPAPGADGPPGTAGAALERVAAATRTLRQQLDPQAIVRVGVACMYVDRLGECRDALQRVADDGRNGGAPGPAITALVSSCVDDWLTGQWDDARRVAGEAIELAREHGYSRWAVVPACYVQALVDAARGDADRARTAVDEMAAWAAPRGIGVARQFADHVRTLCALGSGDFATAFRHAAALGAPGPLTAAGPHALWMLADQVECAARTGHRAEAAARVAAMEAADLAVLSPRLALVTAGSAAVTAVGQRAADLFEAALAVPGADRWPFDLARVHLAYGEHLRRTHARPGAGGQLRTALQIFERLGARPWAVRACASGRLPARDPDGLRARRPGSAELTAHELRIATLAASGLTNKQIAARSHVSHRTVGAHLYRIFPKLGITSRAALRDALSTATRN
jgi:DNA-binding CsgD family transcriptional regulator